MGSFTSMPKVIPAASESELCDADVAYPREGERQALGEFLRERCGRHLASLPPPIERRWIKTRGAIQQTFGRPEPMPEPVP